MKKLLLVVVAVGFYALAQAQSGTVPSGSGMTPSGSIDSSSSNPNSMNSDSSSPVSDSTRRQRMQASGGATSGAIDNPGTGSDTDVQREESDDTMDSSDSMNPGSGTTTTPSTAPSTSP